MDVPDYNRSLHRVALVVAWSIFPLIFIGGLVTSKDAGLSVPDWPNSYGYNMFRFPPRFWTGGILYEHTHRLYASFVGLLTIVLALWACFGETRRWVRILGVSCLSLVILQGVLGGLRVVLLELDLAIVHACIAQAFFCLVMLMCLVTSRWWSIAASHRDAEAPHGKRLIRLAIIAWIVVFLQLMVGATMRHYKAGLAIPDLPLSYGQVIPPTNTPDLKAAQDRLAGAQWWDANESTLGQVWLAFGHRIGAVLVTITILVLAIAILRRHRRSGLFGTALVLLGLLVVQLTLGVLTVLLKKPADIASAHVAVGALVLVTTFVIVVRSMRLYSPAFAAGAPARGFEPTLVNGAVARPAIS
ncbi:MAG TPA: COX15/CtaA family protein [Tepidisphaeraceae bacterium]|jgi:cytochrome c oxidase assembly protein subunit 15